MASTVDARCATPNSPPVSPRLPAWSSAYGVVAWGAGQLHCSLGGRLNQATDEP